ncbi:DUF1674 domain-containing protein [Bartonella sp. HY329]|uniref:DUF1674 domain-containing protein n=1 Tax=unclassified Bartonella TaxID=2645622 RepID=UPI0021C89170|nr:MULTISPECIES: DUF1674 domain-containing protein [unclassified Bartonella]UXM95053.1 DUF1674 domain-containing protein [Bartonella sp. HY329]UXN09376.1 DUF1674 domain-containing protein [Bartonella sp. HY328]
MTEKQQIINKDDNVAEEKALVQETLTPAAKRALAEAQERREQAALAAEKAKRELGGRGGHDPARYGDWEIKGRAIDF